MLWKVTFRYHFFLKTGKTIAAYYLQVFIIGKEAIKMLTLNSGRIGYLYVLLMVGTYG